MAQHGKKYTEAKSKVQEDKLYKPSEACELVKEIHFANFDETVEVSIRLGVDTRKADQNVRGMLSLPHGTGKETRVAVFAEGEQAKAAQDAGADVVGADDLIATVEKGEIAFDAAVATPPMMAKVGRVAKILGPRGLMPNPKLGTVTMDVAEAVKQLKSGRVEYRADRNGIVHVTLGKVSFSAQDLTDNYRTLIQEIVRVKPSSAKGKYIKSVALASTMGPAVQIDPTLVRPDEV